MDEFIDSLLKLSKRETTEIDYGLLRLVYEAQTEAATNNASLSKEIASAVGYGSGSFCHAAAAAMLTTGTRHGPIRAARSALDTSTERATELALQGIKIPGFGNSFFKSGLDPAWERVKAYIVSYYPEQAARINRVQIGLWNAGKRVHVNAAGLTAAACDACQLPYGVEEGLFVMPRINVWWNSFLKTL